ncbi:MAG TPA: ABC transporter permease [Ktedonobacteraceae bacterium]|nr:ABC transporter permease [Ktedonobacteraceae bacterium]
MTFTALLVKELRTHLRRERAIWTVVAYLTILGLLGFVFLLRANAFSGGYRVYLLSQVGAQLFALLAFLQLLWVVFTAPAFTSTAVNGEKERQTYDLLICSRLNAFSLLSAKLIAGLANVLLLIAASLPLFSLVFFFGGVAPSQVLSLLVVYAMTALVAGTFGLCCSTLLKQPAVSTSLVYTFCVVWMFAYWIVYYILGGTSAANLSRIGWVQWLNAWNPIAAMNSVVNAGQSNAATFTLGRLPLAHWIAFTLMSLVVTIILFLLSSMFAKPDTLRRAQLRLSSRRRAAME